jgi:hypothetical protein
MLDPIHAMGFMDRLDKTNQHNGGNNMKPAANQDIRWKGIDILHWEEDGYHFVSVAKGKHSAPLDAAIGEGCWDDGDSSGEFPISDDVMDLLKEIERSYIEADLF